MSEGIRSGVNWIRLNWMSRIRASVLTIKRLGQARHAHQQAVAAGEDGGEDLLDHVALADDDLLQFFLHQPPVLAELLQDVAETARLGGQRAVIPSWWLSLPKHFLSAACQASGPAAPHDHQIVAAVSLTCLSRQPAKRRAGQRGVMKSRPPAKIPRLGAPSPSRRARLGLGTQAEQTLGRTSGMFYCYFTPRRRGRAMSQASPLPA